MSNAGRDRIKEQQRALLRLNENFPNLTTFLSPPCRLSGHPFAMMKRLALTLVLAAATLLSSCCCW